MVSRPVIHGYYRYTDINFEWHQVFENPSDKSALKAFIAPDSLTHPENPLNLHSKENGLTLYMGMLENGESRLLFSSKQVEYIRYWLHAVEMTESLLPLPASSYLLTSSTLKTVSPIIMKTGAEMKQALKDIGKNNKRLKGTDKILLTYRDMFEQARTCWLQRKGTWLAVDFEGWEYEHNLITEYGWSAMTWEDEKEKFDEGHILVEEHMKYRNSTFVIDNRDHYLFGTSQTMRLKELKKFIHDQFIKFTSKGPLYLVFHSHGQDVKYLKQLEAPIDDIQYQFPESDSGPPSAGIYIVDTSSLFAALEGRSDETRGLERMCALLQIPNLDRFHNAGNDAHFTLIALKEMASADPLDKQRAKRWPGQDSQVKAGGGKSVSVEWKPYQVDSDYDDMEGIFPPPKRGYDSDDSQDEAWAS
ncbi:hypothetical protein M422DRAFT_72928 [Sphaerobolus stellatus SS14]|nr:hypothetical protein M422DRAFT_72928 [Sphaerobolus stellatus SS14]